MLISTRTWLLEDNNRKQNQINTLKSQPASRNLVQELAERLRGNLDRATDDDKRFVLEALGTKVLVFGDGTWDVEISIPLPHNEQQIVNTTGKSSTKYRCLNEVDGQT